MVFLGEVDVKRVQLEGVELVVGEKPVPVYVVHSEQPTHRPVKQRPELPLLLSGCRGKGFAVNLSSCRRVRDRVRFLGGEGCVGAAIFHIGVERWTYRRGEIAVPPVASGISCC